MRLISSMLEPIKTALLTVSATNVSRGIPLDTTQSYIYYLEETEASAGSGDNKKLCQSVRGSIHAYLLPAQLSWADSIQSALDTAGVSFRLNSVQIDNLFFHYEWLFEVS